MRYHQDEQERESNNEGTSRVTDKIACTISRMKPMQFRLSALNACARSLDIKSKISGYWDISREERAYKERRQVGKKEANRNKSTSE